MNKTQESQAEKLLPHEIRYLAEKDIDLQIRWIMYLQYEMRLALERIERMKRHLQACK